MKDIYVENIKKTKVDWRENWFQYYLLLFVITMIVLLILVIIKGV